MSARQYDIGLRILWQYYQHNAISSYTILVVGFHIGMSSAIIVTIKIHNS